MWIWFFIGTNFKFKGEALCQVVWNLSSGSVEEEFKKKSMYFAILLELSLL